MLLSQVLTYSRVQAQTDSNGLTDTNGIIWANEANSDLHRRLVAKGVDASQLQESYRDGAVPTTVGNGSTFLYPTNMLFLKTIEINYTDTNPNNYLQAQRLEISNTPGQSSFSWLRGNASRRMPQFADHGDWYEIFPSFTGTDNISQAIRLFYFLAPTAYISTGDTVTYPESTDASILGWRIAASYLYSLKDQASLAQADKFMVNYEKRVTDYIATLNRGSQQPIQSTGLQIDGFQF